MLLNSNVAQYYKSCLYEEAKLSTLLSGLVTDESNEVLMLEDVKYVDKNTLEVLNHAQDMTTMQVKAKLCTDKQLIFVQGFISRTGGVYKSPFVYGDCVVDNGRIIVNTDSLMLNVQALLAYVHDEVYRDAITSQLLDLKVPFPCNDEFVDKVEKILRIATSTESLDIEGGSALILASINKGVAGVINELNCITNNTSLTPCLTPQTIYVGRQSCYEDMLESISSSYYKIHAITGAPGTGKTTTIVDYALSELANGRKVLICSKSNTAVDVIYNKLIKQLPEYAVIRTGGKEYNNKLAGLLEHVVDNPNIKPSDPDINYKEALRQAIQSIEDERNLSTEIELLEEIIAKTPKTFFNKFKIHRLQTELNKLSSEWVDNHTKIPPRFAICDMLKDTLIQQVVEAKETIETRQSLLAYAKKLRKGISPDYYEFKRLLSIFPVWCTSATEISNNIPLIQDMFDIVIVDEASQCDMATIYPVLYRAKKLVAVGDSKQLKFMSFIPEHTNNILLNKLGSVSEYSRLLHNYCENSVFDFAYIQSPKSNILNMQYRGCPELMDFSLKTFYGGLIESATNTTLVQPVQVWNTKGKLNKNGVNEVEVDKVIEILKEYTEDTKSESELKIRTIGVLSPFRAQVKAIEQAIAKKIPTEYIEQYKITVGTAHAFQGEERDLMILSWAVTDNSPYQQFAFINKPNLFNVAVTRADLKVINLISATELPLGLLKSYIEYCKNVNAEDREAVDE